MSTELDKPKMRSVLIAALRDKALWPEAFRWNFFECNSCAVGLMCQILKIERPRDESTDSFMAHALGMTIRDANETFISPWLGYKTNYSGVTPKMVADRLEAIHRTLV